MILESSCERGLLLPLTISTPPAECKLWGRLINWRTVRQPIPVNRSGAFTGTGAQGHRIGATRKAGCDGPIYKVEPLKAS